MSSEKKIEFILQHGWGLSAACWDSWVEILKKDNIVSVPDRGYFGNRLDIDSFKTDNIKVLVSHSFGLYLFPETALKQADFLVIISGFTRFHPEDAREKRRSSMLMRFMRKKVELEPEKLLIDFYNGHDLRGKFDLAPDSKILSEDLRAIDEDEPDMASIGRIKNILIVQGGEDRVVGRSRADYLRNRLPQSKLAFFKDGDHALPFTSPNELIHLIGYFIENGDIPGKYCG